MFYRKGLNSLRKKEKKEMSKLRMVVSSIFVIILYVFEEKYLEVIF